MTEQNHRSSKKEALNARSFGHRSGTKTSANTGNKPLKSTVECSVIRSSKTAQNPQSDDRMTVVLICLYACAHVERYANHRSFGHTEAPR